MGDAGGAPRVRRGLALAVLAAVTLAGGCAPMREAWINPPDPLQPLNRIAFGFNMALDRVIFDPVSKVYRAVTPRPVRGAVRNFFNNLSMPFVIANDLLQGQFRQALTNVGRLGVNTAFGFGGLADPATKTGMPMREQHFAATAGTWGLGPGPYLVLPFFGPTPLVGLPDIPMRFLLSPVRLAPAAARTPAWAVGSVSEVDDRREGIRRVRDAVEPYAFVRSAFMQRKWELIQRARATDEDVDPPFDPIPEWLLEEPPADETSPIEGQEPTPSPLPPGSTRGADPERSTSTPDGA